MTEFTFKSIKLLVTENHLLWFSYPIQIKYAVSRHAKPVIQEPHLITNDVKLGTTCPNASLHEICGQRGILSE